MVVAPAARTPRSVIQVCSAWMTTPTPLGSSWVWSQSATWARRSGVAGSFHIVSLESFTNHHWFYSEAPKLPGA